MPRGRFPCFLFALMPFLGGCVFHSIKDVSLASIEAVDYHERNEIPPPSMTGLPPSLSAQDAEKFGLGNPREEKPHRPLIKAQFTTRKNLALYARENSYPIGARAFFCDQPDAETFLSLIEVYSHGLPIKDRELDAKEEDFDQSNTYYFFFNVTSQDHRSALSYDLRHKPADICFYLSGSNGPIGFKSNVVMISATAIEASLKMMPQALGTD